MKELLTRRFEDLVLRHEANPLGVSEKVRAYLAGDLHSLDSIAVDPGGTEFQQTVWSALRNLGPTVNSAARDYSARVTA